MKANLVRWIGVMGLMAVALVPLAAAAASNEQAVRTTYSSEGRIARAARVMTEATRQATTVIHVDETTIAATVRTPAEREAAAITVDECPVWRALAIDADVRVGEPSRVRACVVAIQGDEPLAEDGLVPLETPATRSVLVFDHGPLEASPAP